MEAILDLYAAPCAPQQPVVWVDEDPLALTAATPAPLPAKPGRPARHDYEYQRRGSCSLFGAFCPRAGWRTVAVRERRTAQDFAAFLHTLVDEQVPAADPMHLVLDNRNTHHPGALSATFPAAEARRLARKLEFHDTPPPGSWLTMRESEWSVLAPQCRGRHRSDTATGQAAVDAWAAQRNHQRATVDWRVRVPDARQ